MYKPRIEVVFGNERIISPSGLNTMLMGNASSTTAN